MQILLDLPDEVAAEAQSRGVSVESYVKGLVDGARKPRLQTHADRFGLGPLTTEEAGRDIRALRKGVTLGGLKIKDLVDEGRRY